MSNTFSVYFELSINFLNNTSLLLFSNNSGCHCTPIANFLESNSIASISFSFEYAVTLAVVT